MKRKINSSKKNIIVIISLSVLIIILSCFAASKISGYFTMPERSSTSTRTYPGLVIMNGQTYDLQCTDSDAGSNDIYTKGHITLTAAGQAMPVDDSCSKNGLVEYQCPPIDKPAKFIYNTADGDLGAAAAAWINTPSNGFFKLVSCTCSEDKCTQGGITVAQPGQLGDDGTVDLPQAIPADDSVPPSAKCSDFYKSLKQLDCSNTADSDGDRLIDRCENFLRGNNLLLNPQNSGPSAKTVFCGMTAAKACTYMCRQDPRLKFGNLPPRITEKISIQDTLVSVDLTKSKDGNAPSGKIKLALVDFDYQGDAISPSNFNIINCADSSSGIKLEPGAYAALFYYYYGVMSGGSTDTIMTFGSLTDAEALDTTDLIAEYDYIEPGEHTIAIIMLDFVARDYMCIDTTGVAVKLVPVSIGASDEGYDYDDSGYTDSGSGRSSYSSYDNSEGYGDTSSSSSYEDSGTETISQKITSTKKKFEFKMIYIIIILIIAAIIAVFLALYFTKFMNFGKGKIKPQSIQKENAPTSNTSSEDLDKYLKKE